MPVLSEKEANKLNILVRISLFLNKLSANFTFIRLASVLSPATKSVDSSFSYFHKPSIKNLSAVHLNSREMVV